MKDALKRCKKQLGPGCLIMAVILLISAGIVGSKLRSSINDAGGWPEWKNMKKAEIFDYLITQSLTKLPLNQEEKNSILKVSDRLTERFRKEAPAPHVEEQILHAGYQSPLPEVFIVLIFQRKMLSQNDERGMLAVNRFAHGMLTGKINREAARPFMQLVLQNPDALEKLREPGTGRSNIDPEREIRFREKIAGETVARAVDILLAAADQAGIHHVRTNLDFSPQLEKIIAPAMDKTPDGNRRQ